MLGEKYGPACLPAQVEVAEFQQILQTGERAGVSTRGLEAAYVRDENATPPCFRLQRRAHTPRPPGAQVREHLRGPRHTLQPTLRAVKLMVTVLDG